MNNAFILTIISGFSTLIGSLLIYIKKNDKIIIGSLSLASGVMLTVSFIDLIRESFNYLNIEYNFMLSILYVLLFILSGIIIALLLDYIIPNNNKLYRVGVYSFLAIMLHNIPEGIITYLTTKMNLSLGIKISSAIALHNIPEGISIALPIYYAKNSKRKAFYYTFISALSEPVGALIAYFFINKLNIKVFSLILGLTAGIMIYISLFELLKESLSYNKKNITFLFFIIGIIIMLISNLII